MPRAHLSPPSSPASTDLDHASCPLCGAAPPQAGSRYRFPPFAAVRCPACGLWYLSPRLAERAMLEAYRSDGYFEGEGVGYSSYLAQEATLRATFRALLEQLAQRRLTGGALLEVGCAFGFFLAEAASFFARRIGTDFSGGAIARAQRHADAVFLGGVDAVPAAERFDCIVLLHVIEHVYRPVELVASLVDRLRPGGAVVLAAPDMGGFWRHLMGRRWPFFKAPEHVSFFTAASLSELLRRGGCRDVERLPYRSVFPLHLVAEKLALPHPAWLSGVHVPLPATTVACVGRRGAS